MKNKYNIKALAKGLLGKKQKEQPALPQEPEEQNKENIIKPKQKPRRSIQRICDICLNRFSAKRTDAKYCSSACRQRAYLKGSQWGYYSNPAEHFLMRTLQMCIKRLIEKEGEFIYHSQLNTWIDQSTAVRIMLFHYLGDDNYFKRKYSNEVDAFYTSFKMSFSKTNIDPINYSIPPQLKNEWLRFLKALEYTAIGTDIVIKAKNLHL